MWLTDNVIKKLIKGTFLATLLLAVQEGGKPLNEAAWILVGATLTTVIDAYATGDISLEARSSESRWHRRSRLRDPRVKRQRRAALPLRAPCGVPKSVLDTRGDPVRAHECWPRLAHCHSRASTRLTVQECQKLVGGLDVYFAVMLAGTTADTSVKTAGFTVPGTIAGFLAGTSIPKDPRDSNAQADDSNSGASRASAEDA